MRLCRLEKLLEYRNKYVIERYCKDFHTTQDVSEEYFTEMLKFLWLSVKNMLETKSNPSLNAYVDMHKEMLPIDNMWHVFILFTKDYTQFCRKYFGNYLHHLPETDDESKFSTDEFRKRFTVFLNYIYEHLGEKTLCKWFAEYCQE